MASPTHKTASGKRLGKGPARFDPYTPQLMDYLQDAHLKPPPKQDWIKSSGVKHWGMMLNDELGDCVIAAKGHIVLLWTALAGTHRAVTLSDDIILKGYEAVGGYMPGQPNTDQGCNMLDAAQYFQGTGFGGHRVSGFASLHTGRLFDGGHYQSAINLFGGVDVGVSLPKAWSNLENSGDVWDVSPSGDLSGDWEPGSLGGHDVPLMGYDSAHDIYALITWGQEQYITGRAVRAYCDEAYTYLSHDWIAGGIAPNKFDLTTLERQLSLQTMRAMPTLNWPSLLQRVEQFVARFGPAAVPLVEALLSAVPMTPAQRSVINLLLETLLANKS